MPSAKKFIAEFPDWAKSEDGIEAVALVGSYARGQQRADSDIDLILIVKNPNHYLGSEHWFMRFGSIREVKDEDYKAVKSRRVTYTNGLEVEFGITTAAWAATDPVDKGTRRVVKDGFKIWVDKKGLLKKLEAALA